MSDKFDLATVKKGMAINKPEFLKEVHKELIAEEQNTLKDFIKGAYRLAIEKEKEAERLTKEATELKSAIDKASKGEWEVLSKIKIPSRFFTEETLRKHGKSMLSGPTEIRFVDLYVGEEEE